MKKLNTLKEILEQYDYFFIDLNGILWNFDEKEFAKTNKMNIFKHSFDTIKFLYENNKHIIFFSNLRRTTEYTKNLLIRSGLKEEWIKNVATSTQALLDYITENNFGNKYNYIGPESEFSLIDKNYVSNFENYDFTITRGFEIKENNKNLYIAKFKKAIDSKKPILFLNPDKESKNFETFCFKDICCFKNNNNIICFGKPYNEIYKYAIKKYNIKDVKKILAIGDKLVTDVLGANNFGIDSVFIINGETKEKLNKINKEKIEDKILSMCKQENLPIPKYILDNLN